MRLSQQIVLWLLAVAFSAGGAWTVLAEIPAIKRTHETHLRDDRNFRDAISQKVAEISTSVMADQREQKARWEEVLRRLDRIEDKVDRRK